MIGAKLRVIQDVFATQGLQHSAQFESAMRMRVARQDG